MPPPRIPHTFTLPLRPAISPILPLNHLPPSRPASHASQGRANKAAQGPGKRLGLKRPASSLVVPGNIIFRQRGTHWFPGENCGMGRDHTIFAREKGYVVFYRDVVGTENGRKGRERKFIGVVFRRGEGLPRRRGAERVRRLGLVGRVREEMGGEVEEAPDVGDMTSPSSSTRITTITQNPTSPLELRPGYQYRESNWHIGRAAERAQVKVREYKRGDRFLAWRKLNARKERNKERRALGSRKKKGGK